MEKMTTKKLIEQYNKEYKIYKKGQRDVLYYDKIYKHNPYPLIFRNKALMKIDKLVYESIKI